MILQMNFMEIVHVELSDEGGVSVMPKVSGQNGFLQSFLIYDADTFGIGVPADDLTVLLGLGSYTITLRMLQSLPMKEAGLSQELGILNAKNILEELQFL